MPATPPRPCCDITASCRDLKVAVQLGRVPRNVAALADPPAQRPSDLATALSLDQARAVPEAAAHVRDSARWTAALAYGLRQSRGPGAEVKGHRSARQQPPGPAQHPPRPRRWTDLRGTHDPPQAAHRRPAHVIGRRSTRPRPPRRASGCWPPPSGTTKTLSSPSPTAARSTRRPTTTTEPRYSGQPASATSGSTTVGTPPSPYC